MPRKGSLRDWPYVKNPLKKNLKKYCITVKNVMLKMKR